ncbi:MAG: T9SS type A sorting domain-containing protein [Calditrichaeota bacterium]|nr:T9SS type A sorting domain-containing protein [Calditrichota bacterium]
MKVLKVFSIIAFTLSLGSVFAQDVDREVWVTNYSSGTANALDLAVAVAVDKNQNVIVTGESMGDGTGMDFVTLKYDKNGELQWTARYNGDANKDDEVEALAVDDAGNIYLTGTSENSDDFTDFVTIKYDTAGNEQWVVRFDGPGHLDDDANAIAVDKDGNVYVAGASMPAGFGGMPDFATVKYNGNGQQKWAAFYNGPGNQYDEANALVLDREGNVLVTGASWGNSTANDFATVKYDGNGRQLWAVRYNGPASGEDFGIDVATDEDGNVVVGGMSTGDNGTTDIVTIKYSPTGEELWVARYDDPQDEQDDVADVEVDALGNIIVTGTLGNSLFNPNSDIVTIKYYASGETAWVASYNGPGNQWDICSAVGVDLSGDIFVTGKSVNENNYADFVTVKYDYQGNREWVERYSYSAESDDNGNDVCVDNFGYTYVVGTSNLRSSGSEITTIKYRDKKSSNPVELSAFKIQQNAGIVHIYWETQSESNSYGYNVQRKFRGVKNAGEWETIAFVASKGTKNTSTSYSIEDKPAPTQGGIFYRLEMIDKDGSVTYSGLQSISLVAPTSILLVQNYPNPFNASTVIQYQVPFSAMVSLNVFNSGGEHIAELVNGNRNAGSYKMTWDATYFSSGIYFCQLKVGNVEKIAKLVFMR